jgi:hypothetical protein
LIHGGVTKSTCDLRLSVINVPKNVPKHVPKFGNVPKLVPKFGNVPKLVPKFGNVPKLVPKPNNVPKKGVHAPEFTSSASFPPVCRRRDEAPPPPRPTTRARNVATGCGEAHGVDRLLQRVGLLVRLQLGDVHLLERGFHLRTLPSLCGYGRREGRREGRD